MLHEAGVPEEVVIRERRSRDTQENAIYAARLLRERGITDVVIVSCTWHVPRARRLFARAGLNVVDAVGAKPPNPTWFRRTYWAARERVAAVKDLFRRERA